MILSSSLSNCAVVSNSSFSSFCYSFLGVIYEVKEQHLYNTLFSQ